MIRPIGRLPPMLLAVLFACSAEPSGPAGGEVPVPRAGARADSLTAFVHVRVVPMDRDVLLPDYTVLVRQGRIAETGPAGEVRVPAGATVIEGRDRYLMPGLTDAHVHMSEDDAPAYVAYGITTVRNMWGWPGLRTIQRRILAGELTGPMIYSYSSGLDAPPTYWPHTQIVESPDVARRVVAEQLAQGWIGIKVYNDLTPEVYDAIIEETHRRGSEVVGHVPVRVGIEHALDAGQRSVEHLTGYDVALTGRRGAAAWARGFDDSTMRALARRSAQRDVWNCPTLSVLRHLSAGGQDQRLRAVAILHQEGVPLLAGSDSGIDATMPGEGLREELRLLTDAGLSPYEALRAATSDVARFLGVPGEFGVVAPGARADLLLLEGNPLSDIRNAFSLDGVMVRGLWLPAG